MLHHLCLVVWFHDILVEGWSNFTTILVLSLCFYQGTNNETCFGSCWTWLPSVLTPSSHGRRFHGCQPCRILHGSGSYTCWSHACILRFDSTRCVSNIWPITYTTRYRYRTVHQVVFKIREGLTLGHTDYADPELLSQRSTSKATNFRSPLSFTSMAHWTTSVSLAMMRGRKVRRWPIIGDGIGTSHQRT